MTCRSGETKESNALLWTWKGAVVKEKFITGNQKFEVQDFSLAELWQSPIGWAISRQGWISSSCYWGSKAEWLCVWDSNSFPVVVSSVHWVTCMWEFFLLASQLHFKWGVCSFIFILYHILSTVLCTPWEHSLHNLVQRYVHIIYSVNISWMDE